MVIIPNNLKKKFFIPYSMFCSYLHLDSKIFKSLLKEQKLPKGSFTFYKNHLLVSLKYADEIIKIYNSVKRRKVPQYVIDERNNFLKNWKTILNAKIKY